MKFRIWEDEFNSMTYHENDFMFSIGLEDKNRKEIFLRDLVSTSYGSNPGSVYKLKTMRDVVEIYNLVDELGATLEVVGNLHDN